MMRIRYVAVVILALNVTGAARGRLVLFRRGFCRPAFAVAVLARSANPAQYRRGEDAEDAGKPSTGPLPRGKRQAAEESQGGRSSSADEVADLGALHVRLARSARLSRSCVRGIKIIRITSASPLTSLPRGICKAI